MFSKVRVQYRDGGVARNKKVDVSINGAFTRSAYTDNSGVAIIEHTSSGTAKVYINGTHLGTFRAPGETGVFVP